MVIGESVRTSLEEVKAHPLRSAFTLVGVILGTLAIVVVMSVLDGVQAAVWQGVDDLGLDGVLYMTQRKPTDPHRARESAPLARASRRKTRNGSMMPRTSRPSHRSARRAPSSPRAASRGASTSTGSSRSTR